MFALGKLTSVWGQDADEFKPERWLERVGDATRIKNVSKFSFPAFRAGPRKCLGRHLAMLEMKTAVAALLFNFRCVVLSIWHHAKYVASLIHPMEEPLQVRVTPRFHEDERQQ
jgi:midchain alkane hydroxylase